MANTIPQSPESHQGFVYIKDMDIAQKVSIDTSLGPPKMEEHLKAIQEQSGHDLQHLILVAANALFFMSGEKHAALKQRILRSIGPFRKGDWEMLIDKAIDQALSGLEDKKQVDLVSEFTYPLFTQATQSVLGIAPGDPAAFEYWVSRLQELLEPLLPLRVLRKMEGAFSDLLGQMRGQGSLQTYERYTPLLAELLADPVKGFKQDDMYGAVLVLYGASLNVSQTLANVIFHLLSAPEAYRASASDPEWVREHLEYLIKIGASPRYIHRIAHENKVSGDYTLTQRDNVLVDLPEVHTQGCPFNHAEKWQDESIRHNSHLAFGRGIHYCVGAGYARHVIERAIPALFNHFSEISLVNSEPDISDNPQAVALNSLHCHLLKFL